MFTISERMRNNHIQIYAVILIDAASALECIY